MVKIVNDMRTCPQCKHVEHLPLKEKLNKDGTSANYEGGCNQVVYIEFKVKEMGGHNYHEHCDCDYDGE